MSSKHSSRIGTLDIARGLAALAVCAGHLRAAIFVDFGQLESTSLLQKFFYAMTSLGHEAVMIFFVLSGYLVGGSVLKQKHKFEWLKYSITRLTRLWVILIPALLLTLIVDQTLQFFQPEVFAGANIEMWASGPDKSNYSSSIDTLIGNIFFQQTIFVPVYGTNSPLWSLSNEFYYYFIFPSLLLLIGYLGQRNNFGLRLFYGFGGVIALSLLPSSFATGFLVFCMGALVSWFNGQETRDKGLGSYQILIGCAAFIFALYLSKANVTLRFVNHEILIGLGFSLFLVSLAKVRLRFILLRRSAAFLADISYSLYLTHFPVVLLIAATCYGTNQVKPDVIGLSQFIGWLGVVLLIAVFFWWLFERHTDSIRNKVMVFFARRKGCAGGNE